MRIAVLGPLEVSTDDGTPVVVPGAKERMLLAVLASAAPGAVSTERLIEALWNGSAPSSARKSLQVHVVRLRSALDPARSRGSAGGFVVRRGPGYALVVERSDVDAHELTDRSARGRALLARGDAAEADAEFGAALDLWRGEPYADWPDAEFAGAERHRLVEARGGTLAAAVEAALARGRHAEVLPELEARVVEEPLREGWWRLLMLALYRDGRQADALAAARRLRALLAEELGTAPGPAVQAMERAILAQDPSIELLPVALPGRGPPRAGGDTCPYKGLVPYEAADAALFHGRERLVSRLVGRLVDVPVLVVSGRSGAGKSSVVRAGLVPALGAGALPGSQAWYPVVLTPGRHPGTRLAERMRDAPPGPPVLLVCDQFEEIYAPEVDGGERSAFLGALLDLLDRGTVVRCVVVVRGDRVGRLADHAAFLERQADALVLVPSMTGEELRDVVRRPAEVVGLDVQDDLLATVVADVLGRPAALPLLSTALVGTWERRSGGRLTLAGYLAAGGVTGALTRSAETAWSELDEGEREVARRLLVRLADTDDDGALIRRPVLLAELDLDGDAGAVRRRVVAVFVRRRLLTLDGNRLDVAHEALLSGWPRLARWLEDDAAGRGVRRHLAPAALEWDRRGRPDDELYRGGRLAVAADWAAAGHAELSALEHGFLEASKARADAELRAAEARIRAGARSRRRLRWLAAGLAVVLVLATVTAVLAVRSQRTADRASLVADANRLAALSGTAGSLHLSLLLAAQALRLADTPDTRFGLLGALVERRRAVRAVPFSGRVLGAGLTGTGETLFIGAGDHAEVWRVAEGLESQPVFALPDAWYFMAASPTEEVLLSGGRRAEDGLPWIGVVAADGEPRTLVEGEPVMGVPLAGAFREDGRRAAVLVAAPDGSRSRWRLIEVDVDDPGGGEVVLTGTTPVPVEGLRAHVADDGRHAVVWDARAVAPAVLLDVPSGSRTGLPPSTGPGSLGFRALPSGAAQLRADGTVTLYDRRGTVVQDLDAHQVPVRDVAVAPDGTWAVTAGDGAAVFSWDVDAGTGRWTQRERLTGHRGNVITADIDATGRLLYTAALDDTVIEWDMTGGAGGWGGIYPSTGHRWIVGRPRAIGVGGPVVAPTRPAAGPLADADDRAGSGDSVAATFIDTRTGEVEDSVVVGGTVPGEEYGASVAVSPDGGMVAVTWGLGASIVDTGDRTTVGRIVLPAGGAVGPDGRPLPAMPVWSAAWTPDGRHVLLGADPSAPRGRGGQIVLADPRTGDVERRMRIPSPAQAIEPSPDGRHLAVLSRTRAELYLLDAAATTVVRTVALGADDRPTVLTFSPDGRMVAVGGAFGLLHVIDTRSWRPVFEPPSAHEDAILQVEWLPDGRTVASSGIDGTIRLLDAASGLARARPLPGSTGIAPGATHLLPDPVDEITALSGERPGRRYSLDPRDWLDEACTLVGRDLSPSEWARYLPGREYERTCAGRR